MATVAATGCGLATSATPVPTSCGGSHTWPPNDYRAAPAELSVELVADMTVRIENQSHKTWTARIAAWGDLTCTGWVSADAPRVEVPPGNTVERSVPDPGWGVELRIGVELWDHPCGEMCLDLPDGFAWHTSDVALTAARMGR